MRCEIAVAVGLCAAVGSWSQREARACGPDFPIELLSHRDDALLELIDGEFMVEAAHLVPAPAIAFNVVEGSEPEGARSRGGERERDLYDRGAGAFAAGDHERAAALFTQLLALPADERHHRSTWAAFMLGRIRFDVAPYRQVRQLAAGGFADELGLAAASLGQEARLQLDSGDLTGAVHLYAEQAAHGHAGAAASLLFVVRDAIAHRRDRELAGDPVGQRLLAAYLYTRDGELDPADRVRLWAELSSARSLAGADRLAAAAYRSGHWDRAARLARRQPDAALSRWVLAKLALRDGDTATAERLLGQVDAELSLCQAETSPLLARARGERAALALFGGRELEAMGHIWAARQTYPIDAVYVAERVLTIEELRDFVAAIPATDTVNGDWTWTPMSLRDLLARRLMRAGRFFEAGLHLPAEHRVSALVYADSLARADATDDPIDRARHLFVASIIARRQGLELLGTSHSPDWAMYDAQYDAWYGEWRLSVAFTAFTEWIRAADSAPAPPHRYHYRFLASQLAERAADQLPEHSQAFAATLCHAARYVFNQDPDRAQALYRRYLERGPSVDFAATFGQDCPVPEFDRARRFLPPERSWGWLAASLALFALGIVAARNWTRRRPFTC